MNRILFLVQLPPPVHGAAAVNKSIMVSKAVNSAFETLFIDISPAKDMADIGSFSISKLLATLFIIFRTLYGYLKFKPNLVYLTLSPHGLALYKDGLLAIILKAMGGKLVFHMHGKGIRDESERSRLKKFIYRLIFKNADVIHLAENLFHDVNDVRDKSKSITAISNGIAPFNASPPPANDEIITFIFLSNFMPSKGADILIRAAHLIPEMYQSRFRLKLIGSPNDQNHYSEILKLVDESTHGNIQLHGAMYGNKKFEALRSSQVFVLPTRNECFPLSILEAMSAGLAVISTHEGAIPDIVETGVTGELIEHCTPEKLAEKMLIYIADPAYAKKCGGQGFEKFKKQYTIDKFEEALVSVLADIISSNSNTAGISR